MQASQAGVASYRIPQQNMSSWCINDAKSDGVVVNHVHMVLDFPKISSLQVVRVVLMLAPPSLVCPIHHILGYDTPLIFDITTNFSFTLMSTFATIATFDPS